MVKRALAVTALWAVALVGCSHYPDDFKAEPMVIFELDVVDVTGHEATLTWKTSKKGTSDVYYRRVDSFEEVVTDGTEVLDHRVTLENLFPSREYFCRVVSSNEDGYREEWQDIVIHTKPWPPPIPPEPDL